MSKKNRKRNKIAMIGHKRIQTREGGVEVVVSELAPRMARRGIAVDAYNRIDSKEYLGQREYNGVRIIRIPTFKVSALNAFVYSVLASIRAVFGGYDCIHYHAEGPCAMLWLPRLFGIRTVATIHGLDWQRAKWGGFSTKYIKFGEKVAAKYADEMIVLSEANKKYFKENYGRDTRYIPNGISRKSGVFEPREIKEKFGVGRDEYILFLARIVPEKGLHYLIDSFKKIRTDKKLIIAGGIEPQTEYIKEVMEAATDDSRIIFAGFVGGRLLEELYANCLTYVLPSDIEGMAMSLLEAISYGAPCLVSDIPENIEVVGEDMPSFKKGDTESLRLGLEEIIREKPDVGALREKILAEHDWDKITDATLELYDL